ncbi:hypothetical protein J2848_002593 [Azospirillum lipoferum]|nr:hypothetical protein [Azospirillum lipoferum]
MSGAGMSGINVLSNNAMCNRAFLPEAAGSATNVPPELPV